MLIFFFLDIVRLELVHLVGKEQAGYMLGLLWRVRCDLPCQFGILFHGLLCFEACVYGAAEMHLQILQDGKMAGIAITFPLIFASILSPFFHLLGG